MDTGLFLSRLVLGLLMAAHGSQKLFGWFGGYGLEGTGGYFEQLGFRPGRFFAATAALAEFGGGLLVALGFLGPVGPALIVSVMIVAAIAVHWANGLFAMDNGIEVPLLYTSGVATIALAGPGRYSLDYALGLTWFGSVELAWAALGLGVLGGFTALALRRPQPARA